jgi:hypothetical protein
LQICFRQLWTKTAIKPHVLRLYLNSICKLQPIQSHENQVLVTFNGWRLRMGYYLFVADHNLQGTSWKYIYKVFKCTLGAKWKKFTRCIMEVRTIFICRVHHGYKKKYRVNHGNMYSIFLQGAYIIEIIKNTGCIMEIQQIFTACIMEIRKKLQCAPWKYIKI